MHSVLLDIEPEMGLLDHAVVLFLIFFLNLHSVLHSNCTLYNLTNSAQHSNFSKIFQHIIIFFNSSHPKLCEVIPHCDLD